MDIPPVLFIQDAGSMQRPRVVAGAAYLARELSTDYRVITPEMRRSQCRLPSLEGSD
jgi:hypothetical protein